MPAKHFLRVTDEGTYSHVYNKGVEGRTIFNDNQDYEVFLSFLKDYLTSPADRESNKKTFTIKGRTYSGTPHQPKNYYNKIDLIAYSLSPDHFHLILHQITKDTQTSFFRSLCTRYSMYFNKKYSRKGSLFDGPYKSAQIDNLSKLPYLSRYMYEHKKDSAEEFSSYLEYIGERETSWVKPEVVLAKVSDFKDFVKKYEPEQAEELLKGIIFDDIPSQPLERRILEPRASKSFQADEPKPEPRPKIPEFAALATATFMLLFTIGFRNVWTATSAAEIANPTAIPIVAGTEDAKQNHKTTLVIIVKDATGVNIRQEPTTSSQVIGKANAGDAFELISIKPDWYQVKLHDERMGFVSIEFAQIETEENNP